MEPKRAGERQDAQAVTELAARQHGVVALRQMLALGLGRGWVKGQDRRGWLHRVHRGVYAVGHPSLTDAGRWMAAVLACGQGAVLSHRSAAELWGLLARRTGSLADPAASAAPERGATTHRPVDVTVPTDSGRRVRAGIRIHRSVTLGGEDVGERQAIPVTTPGRTLLDLATGLTRRRLERAIDEAERLRLCGPAELEAVVSRHRGEPGSVALHDVLAGHAVGSTLTRSELEEHFLGLCRTRRLPAPKVNEPLLGYIIDFLWPEARLIVEVDGRASHGTRQAFQRDRDRDSRLTAQGYRTLRFTWWDVTRRPAVVADRVRRSLRA